MCGRKTLGRRQADAAYNATESGVAMQALPSRIDRDVNHPAVAYFISSVEPCETFFFLTETMMNERQIIRRHISALRHFSQFQQQFLCVGRCARNRITMSQRSQALRTVAGELSGFRKFGH